MMHKSYHNNNERIKEKRVAYILELEASGRECGGQRHTNSSTRQDTREAVKAGKFKSCARHELGILI